ncbi:MAG: glucosaminidase domain-containing protein [Enterococcus sp.]|uniref:glucosaminidase domain-containing protein n=1 Tax=Enterococcus sp. TaxID=35783 RepID=UPI002649B35C|nr:glucosaminidase domain-containing protein [Enterococcus sp.]MDN6002035.1 glucosaminidase domain-containing protein [Enterococcus sp.]MDN6216331.1 glucosaminidase domain-containing protein [Enterococcus sp.]MDN6561892.1 glucosaminidase domain-containing protein [Enterococcus sp.]MDN6583153.1 glucosaminidase domain-containing protein [Enterococcus sp.]MDN6615849.1 glucosaminidase domain-containing protein [Enterococcus sp.]
MKKIIVGACGILVFLGGLAGLRSGALKAGELTTDTSLIVETGTTSEQARGFLQETEGIVPEESMGESEIPVTESSSRDVPEESNSSTAPSSESSTTDSSASTSSTQPSSSSSASSSSTKPSNSSNSTSSNSTKPSSTTPSNTAPSTTQPSWSEPSSVPPSATPTEPSTSPNQAAPTPPAASAPTPVVPSTPAAAAPATPNSASVQSNAFAAPTAPEAFDPTSNVNLPSELKTAGVAQSDLKGFELPLLNSFKDKNHAAMIYEGIKQLGAEQAESYTTEQFTTDLYQHLFDLDVPEKIEKLPEEILVGSLIYQKEKDKNVLLGIAIGDDYYLTVEDVEIEEDEEKKATADASETETKDKKDKKDTQRQVVIASLDLEDELSVQEMPKGTLTDYGKEVLKEYPASMNFTENDSAKAFIEKVGEDAQKLGQDYDVFASVMIAQALIESGSGTSTLSLSPNHNLFGIKGTYQGQSVSMATQEDRGNGELYSINSAFRKYPNFAASLGDYVKLLRGGISGNDAYYKQTWRSTAKNYLRTTSALTGTYATDTTYGKKLNSIIALYHLTKYDQPKADGNSGIFIKGKNEIPAEYRSKMKYPDFNGVNYNSSGSYPVGQCTWYAFNRVKQLGKSVDDYMGNGGQWAAKGKALGYQVSQKPKVGWLISFKPGVAGSDPRYGHVAFVEAVRPEGILISEGNVYGGTVISYRVIDNALAASDQVAYIKAK